jgi:peptidoglycan hydrolase CwlO-like protein
MVDELNVQISSQNDNINALNNELEKVNDDLMSQKMEQEALLSKQR